MNVKTMFKLGDVADFALNGKFPRIRVDEIRIRLDARWPGRVLIEYRQHFPQGNSKWWPESQASGIAGGLTPYVRDSRNA